MTDHLPELITAIVGVLTAIGAGFRFMWTEFKASKAANEASIATLKKENNERLTEIEKQLEECREREQVSHLRRAKHLTVIELLWQEVLRLSPRTSSRKAKNTVLDRAKHLLDELKDPDSVP